MNNRIFKFYILFLGILVVSCHSKFDKKNITPIKSVENSSNLGNDSINDQVEIIETTEIINDETNLYGSWKNFELNPKNEDAPKEWILNFYDDNSYNFKFENKYYSPRVEWYITGNSIVVSNSCASREIGTIKNISKDTLEIYFLELKTTGKFIRISSVADKY